MIDVQNPNIAPDDKEEQLKELRRRRQVESNLAALNRHGNTRSVVLWKCRSCGREQATRQRKSFCRECQAKRQSDRLQARQPAPPVPEKGPKTMREAVARDYIAEAAAIVITHAQAATSCVHVPSRPPVAAKVVKLTPPRAPEPKPPAAPKPEAAEIPAPQKTAEQRQCIVEDCKRMFTPANPWQSSCSPACQAKRRLLLNHRSYLRRKEEKLATLKSLPCPICKKMFKPVRPRQKTCSEACQIKRSAQRNKRRYNQIKKELIAALEPRVCPDCQETFQPAKLSQKRCGRPECRSASRSRRRYKTRSAAPGAEKVSRAVGRPYNVEVVEHNQRYANPAAALDAVLGVLEKLPQKSAVRLQVSCFRP